MIPLGRGLPDIAVKGAIFQFNTANPANPQWDNVAAGNAAWADAHGGSSPIRWTSNYYVEPDPLGLGYTLPAGLDFVPVIYGDIGCPYGSECSSANLAKAVANSTTGELITFMEPNNPTPPVGSNMTVARAAALWPSIRATGLRIGSPTMQWRTGQAIPTWFTDFMTAISNDVDFICIGIYGENLASPAASVTAIHTSLQLMRNAFPTKPIWLREFGLIDFSSLPSSPTDAQVTAFYGGMVALLRTRSYVERYGAYHIGPGKDSTSSGYNNIGFYNTNGSITATGTYYKGLPDSG